MALSDKHKAILHWLATARRGDLFPPELGFNTNEWDIPMREMAIAVMRELAELEKYQPRE